YGVWITGTTVSGTVLEGNYIGVDNTGLAKLANFVGVRIDSAPNTLIGGLTSTPGTGAGNVIAGNTASGISIIGPASGTVVEGSIVGLGAAGSTTCAGSQNQYGIAVGTSLTANVTIGGTTATARNIISGSFYGVRLFGSDGTGNVVEGNYIGTDITGTLARGN